MTFARESDYEKIHEGDWLEIDDLRKNIKEGKTQLIVRNITTGEEMRVLCELTERTRKILLSGGLLEYTKTNTTS